VFDRWEFFARLSRSQHRDGNALGFEARDGRGLFVPPVLGEHVRAILECHAQGAQTLVDGDFLDLAGGQLLLIFLEALVPIADGAFGSRGSRRGKQRRAG
jgi:hypothetical protein